MKLPGFRYTRGTWVERFAWLAHRTELDWYDNFKAPFRWSWQAGLFRWYAEGAGGGD